MDRGTELFDLATTWGAQDAEVGGLLDEIHVELLVEAGDADELLRLAEQGNDVALQGRADLLAEAGHLEDLQAEAEAGNPYAAYQLQRFVYEDHPVGKAPTPPRRNKLQRFNPNLRSPSDARVALQEAANTLYKDSRLPFNEIRAKLIEAGETSVGRQNLTRFLLGEAVLLSWEATEAVLEVLTRASGRSLDDPSPDGLSPTYRTFFSELHQAATQRTSAQAE